MTNRLPRESKPVIAHQTTPVVLNDRRKAWSLDDQMAMAIAQLCPFCARGAR